MNLIVHRNVMHALLIIKKKKKKNENCIKIVAIYVRFLSVIGRVDIFFKLMLKYYLEA